MGAFARFSSRAKNATVVSAGIASNAASRDASSFSFQRSTPSTTMNRRPIANVIAFSAAATASGADPSPSNSSTP